MTDRRERHGDDADAGADGGAGADAASAARDGSVRSGKARLVAALGVRRNAALGFGVGLAVTLVWIALFVVIPGPRRSPWGYAALAFVLAASLGALLTVVLTMVRAHRLATRE